MSQAREAVAKYHSHQEENKAEGCTISHTHKVSMDHVIIANGASGALELALTALLDEDSVLLGTIRIIYAYFVLQVLDKQTASQPSCSTS